MLLKHYQKARIILTRELAGRLKSKLNMKDI
jgi:hypothetical protein